jgi:hypothetical protein
MSKNFSCRSDKFEDQYEGTFSELPMKKSENCLSTILILKFYKTHREQVATVGILMNMNRLPCGKYSRKTQRDWPSTIGRLQNALAQKIITNSLLARCYIDYKRIHPFDDMFFPFYSREKLSIRA